MTEAERKRRLALEASGGAPLVVRAPQNVRWLLCGRGRPVDAGSCDYTVVLGDGAPRVHYADIEHPRVRDEERLEELGYELAPQPWYLVPDDVQEQECDEAVLVPLRRHLGVEEVERYRRAGADTAAAVVATIAALHGGLTEIDVAGLLAGEARARNLVVRVNLVAGAERQPVHRHPLPTRATLGAHALLALTAERDGLHVSMTRLVSFGPPPARLAELVARCADVDAAVLAATRPGRTHGDVFDDLARAYADAGFPDEWRHHHQGGLTGYLGREVFAVPDEPTPLPLVGAVAWNPSLTGGAKSEDTALFDERGVDVITRTAELPELANGRPAIVEL